MGHFWLKISQNNAKTVLTQIKFCYYLNLMCVHCSLWSNLIACFISTMYTQLFMVCGFDCVFNSWTLEYFILAYTYQIWLFVATRALLTPYVFTSTEPYGENHFANWKKMFVYFGATCIIYLRINMYSL